MRRQLEWAGYGVITTGLDADALELIDERRPDALILEATLPRRSGYTLARELRSQPHTSHLPILMVSARAGKLDREFAFTSGADDYIKKPFRCADIVSRLAYLAPARPVDAVPTVRRPARQLAGPVLALS
jgi:DNA-binding response OmpR family regulator